ncbi:MAG: ABC transporter substrate-binding protein [Acidobacteria bacterium]|nr:ABC transporter substrate-binding protein [Acidobacteriota bacterium]
MRVLRKIGRLIAFGVLFGGTLCGPLKAQTANVIRVGHFPNITHSQALIGKGRGDFEKAMGPQVRVEWKVFNAGPSAIEALYAGAIDMAYIGPNPAISGYVRSQGQALRIVAGASSGGASLIVRADSGITKPEHFHGKKIATPQLGNTQDVALRAWLAQKGMKPREKGGDVTVIPIANPDQLTLFLQKQLDAAWAPEPWASRLIREANGKLFLDERDLWPNGQFVSAHVIARTEFLQSHRDLVKKWLKCHVELTQWINKNPTEAKKILNEEIRKATTKALPVAILNDAYSRFQVTYDPLRQSLLVAARAAFENGMLGRSAPDLNGIYDLSVLNEVLMELKAKPIS